MDTFINLISLLKIIDNICNHKQTKIKSDMKKLLLAISTLISFSSFAQIDVAVTINTPIVGQIVYPGEPFDITGTITNTTKNQILASDLFAFAWGGLGTYYPGGGSTTYYTITHGVLDSGQTATFTQKSVYFNFTTDNPAGTVCVKVKKIVSNTPVDDANAGNNESCRTLSFKVQHPAGVNELSAAESISLFPNPAKDVLNINFEKAVSGSVFIFDITGREVAGQKLTGTENKIDVSAFQNGIYLYQIKADNGQLIKSSKFTVSK